MTIYLKYSLNVLI